jgi:(1->4)-alpha-D-glucan 1-alpha-D-glucosylmutase
VRPDLVEPETVPGVPRIPLATYRLQFNGAFTFADARRLVPYLAALGVSDIYTSSLLAARPGSTHGYDIVDHGRLNPELGSDGDFTSLAGTLRAYDMGLVLDMVPNHMGIADGANAWWNDVLENGPSSPYAEYFDIDWDPVKRQLANKLLLPVLGDQYGRVLENQELTLELVDGAFRLRYYAARFPIAPRSTTRILGLRQEALTATLGDAHADLAEYGSIITALQNLPGMTETAAERVRERRHETDVIRRRLARLVGASEPVRESVEETLRVFNGKRGDPRSFDLLDQLLAEQAYRLAHWRVAADEINYRRFFDVNELAAIRMEDPTVFRETHRRVLALVESGAVTGLRIDHPDGLFNPPEYFRALQRACAARLAGSRPDASPAPADRPFYIVAEKILARGERLPARWAVHGTTGYEFLNLLGGLQVQGLNARALTAAYAAFTGRHERYTDVVYQAKGLIMDAAMSSELAMLGHALDRLADRNRSSRDFTLRSLTQALREIVACFPVYRTYISPADAEVELQDRACVEVATAFAKRRNPATNSSIFDFVRDVLLLRYPDAVDETYRRDQQIFVQKFQQFTAPVMAKGAEDTAFYRYVRLLSLNEVGGDPDQFGVEVEDFHKQCVTRQERWPHTLSTTSTHDTKRSEDVRARISVLSEMPRQWRAALGRWHRLNRRHLGKVDDRPAPDRTDEYLLYQTLVGAWPLEASTPEAMAAFTTRIQEYITKATREAKVHTSWINPDEGYDEAVRRFVAKVLAPSAGNRFLGDFATFHRPIALLGMLNSLTQTLVKIAAPGVPDFYRGTELWDLSLVDPDNRRPVDFEARERELSRLEVRVRAGHLDGLVEELLSHWADARVKLYTIQRALASRRARPALFQTGAYVPLRTVGSRAAHVLAFARQLQNDSVVVVVPRLMATLTGDGARLPLGPGVWADTRVLLAPGLAGPRRNAFTLGPVPAAEHGSEMALPVAEVLDRFPLGLLEPTRG